MIFITLGSREYQFNRLLVQLDNLVETGEIDDEIFAQIGGSTYEPKHYEWKRFIDREQFARFQDKATLIISHGGTGALISALKKGKKVIAVPRLARFGEHIDDHQVQITDVLSSEGYLLKVEDMSQLSNAIIKASNEIQFKKFLLPSRVEEIVRDFLDLEVKRRSKRQ